MPDSMVLAEALALAVPLWMDDLQKMPTHRRTAVAQRWAQVAADQVASRGDILQFRTKALRSHTTECLNEQWPNCDCLVGTAEAFNALAKGLATLALCCPGGVTWLGIHWCVEHPGGLRVKQPAQPSPYLSSYLDGLDCSATGIDGAEMPGELRIGGRPVVTARTTEVL